MNSSSRLVQFLTAPFILWCAFFVVGTYYMISFDVRVLKQIPSNAGFSEMVSGYAQAIRLAQVKKGIDLAGGTYLVLGVEVEKALENRLQIESKSLDDLFKKSEERTLKPVSKEVKNQQLVIEFADEDAAKSCIHFIREKKAQVLRGSVNDTKVTLKLTPEIETSIRTGAVEQAVNVLGNRLSNYGVEGITVQQHGDRQVVVQLPGIDDPEHIRAAISKTAHLEFKIVEDMAASEQTLLDKFDGDLPSDKMIVPASPRGEEGGVSRYYLVSVFPDVTGDHLTSAEVGRDQFNKPIVKFKLDSQGAREFAELTAANIQKPLGIVIDDMMYSAPIIQSEISSGAGEINNISGGLKEAFDLSVVLRSGALVAPIKFEQENRVGASLGQDAIHSGVMSCIVALLLLFVFGIFYYKIPGFFAVLALVCNMFLTMLFLSYFRATLTLPGIAGMVLTIGMAIDCSILIYENIKEELAAGVPLRNAIHKGFNGVMPVILDSNITTFMTGFILYQFGGPAIKGFAITLMAGIIATLLAGVSFLRSLFSFSLDVLNARDIKF